MTFFQKLKYKLASFMQGRHGMDNLGMFTLLAGLAVSLIGSMTQSALLALLGWILYILTLYRMFSRNNAKRTAENAKYLSLTSGWKKKIRQFILRLKYRKQYKYFRCPGCRTLLRQSRGLGTREIRCVRCEKQFTVKS